MGPLAWWVTSQNKGKEKYHHLPLQFSPTENRAEINWSDLTLLLNQITFKFIKTLPTSTN